MPSKRPGWRKSIPLRNRVTCPHCWEVFPPDKVRWVAEHPDLIGDPRLGDQENIRFLPTRFNIVGAALDARGFACHHLGCPNCHLSIPRPLLEMRRLFVSIFGAPASGKSYFLAAMAWRMRKTLPKRFRLSFNDADPSCNMRLQEYEELQFLNPEQDQPVQLDKTQEAGDLYNEVLHGNQPIRYPNPFLFSVTPQTGHPNHAKAADLSAVLCLYDNAGESFLPGADSALSPVTRHLAKSQVLLFLFDPTQDPHFRRACRGKTEDPQMKERTQRLARERPVRQETVLLEAGDRIRRLTGLGQNDKHNRPLVVVVTKFDSWSFLLKLGHLNSPWEIAGRSNTYGLQVGAIHELSDRIRNLLVKLSPQVVTAAEALAEEVIFIPVSAMGRGPEVDPATGEMVGIKPRDIRPMWCEVPLLYAIMRTTKGMVGMIT